MNRDVRRPSSLPQAGPCLARPFFAAGAGRGPGDRRRGVQNPANPVHTGWTVEEVQWSLNWGWIALAATIPAIVGFGVAAAVWRTGQIILGNVAGTAVAFGAAIGFIMREHGEIEAIVNACIEAGTTCFPEPGAFIRFAIYACIGMVQAFAIFWISLKYEIRVRRRDYAPEWR